MPPRFALAMDQRVNYGDKHKGDERGSRQSSDNSACKWSLRVGTLTQPESEREQPKNGCERSH